MPKVHLFLDSTYGLHLWDSTTLEALGAKDLELTEVPQELIHDYNRTAAAFAAAQENLKKYYRETYK